LFLQKKPRGPPLGRKSGWDSICFIQARSGKDVGSVNEEEEEEEEEEGWRWRLVGKEGKRL
jgi:hypothetical protein